MSGLLLNYRNIFSTNLDDDYIRKTFSLRDRGLGTKSSSYNTLEREQYSLMRQRELNRIKNSENKIFSDRKMVRIFFNAHKKDILRDLNSKKTNQKPTLSELKNRILDSTAKILQKKEQNPDRAKFIEDFKKRANSQDRKNDLLLKKSFWEYEGRKDRFNASVNSMVSEKIKKLQPEKDQQKQNISKQELWIEQRAKSILKSRIKVNLELSTKNEINNRVANQNYDSDFKARMVHLQQKEGKPISSLRVEHFYHQYKSLKAHCEKNKINFDEVMNKSNLSVPKDKLSQLKSHNLNLQPLTQKDFEVLQKRTREQGLKIQERLAKQHAAEELKNNKKIKVDNNDQQKLKTQVKIEQSSRQKHTNQNKKRDFTEQAKIVANAKQKQMEEQQKKKRLSV